MAVKYGCDGCGKMIGGDPVKVGNILVRDYCEKCSAFAKSYLERVNDLHTHIAEEWNYGLEEIRVDFRNNVKLALLPDCSE